jgi:gamma-glutamylcyclotransferase (GGCT)/AIG2-like uncharacterized protein YtfP
MKYIAYGSNMSTAQMRRRCPDAKLIGIGWLPSARLEFYLHATVEASESSEDRVPVAVWEISKADEQHLDRYEGYPTYYTKERRRVKMDDGSEINGMIYIMKEIRNHPPTDNYYSGILNAYYDLGLVFEIKRVLAPAFTRSLARTAG